MEQENYNSLGKYKKNKKYICLNCGEKVKEPSKGCPNCNFSKNYKERKYFSRYGIMMRSTNLLYNLLFVLGWLTIVIGFIYGLVMGGYEKDGYELLISLNFWLIFIAIGIFMLAFSEIIKILHDIRYKIWLK